MSVWLPDDMDLGPYMDPLPLFKEIKPPWKFTDEVIGEFSESDRNLLPKLPWPKTYDSFSFRKAETTIFFGFSSHGKSAVASQVVASLISQGYSAAIASLEMHPRKTLAKMARQCACKDWLDEEKIRQFMRWADKRLWMFNYQGMIEPRIMLAIVRYTFERYNTDFFVIDNLMKCIRGQDNYNGEKDFIDELISVAKYYDKHIILVAHVRKTDESKRPSRYDIRGSSTISDQVDNCLSVWRNKDLERRLREGDHRDREEFDTIVGIDKQRETGIEGEFGLYYDGATCQFLGHVAEKPVRYMEILKC
jgi:twinkle protein